MPAKPPPCPPGTVPHPDSPWVCVFPEPGPGAGKGWSELRKSFPPQAGPTREARVLELIRAGNYVPPTWRAFTVSDAAGNVLKFFAAEDLLKLGTAADAVRTNVTHRTSQQIDDWLGWVAPTAFMEDVVTMAAKGGEGQFIPAISVKAEALEGKQTAQTSTYYMERHSQAIDRRQEKSFIAGPFKQWINSQRIEHPDLAAPQGTGGPGGLGKRSGVQYGYFDPGAPYSAVFAPLKLYQRPGATHSVDYTDASEAKRPYLAFGELTPAGGEAKTVLLADVAADPKVAHLLSPEGPLRMHHPWLPVCDLLSEGGACKEAPGGLGLKPGGGGGGGAGPAKPGPTPSEPTKGYSVARLLPLLILGGGALAWYKFLT